MKTGIYTFNREQRHGNNYWMRGFRYHVRAIKSRP
jgi:hypothetical protein